MKKHFEQNRPIMTDGEQRRIWRAIHDARRAGRQTRPRRLAAPIAALGGVAVALLVVVRMGALDSGNRHAVDQLVSSRPGAAAPAVVTPTTDQMASESATETPVSPGDATSASAPAPALVPAPAPVAEKAAVAGDAVSDDAVSGVVKPVTESAPPKMIEEKQESAPVAGEVVRPSDHASAKRAAALRQQTQDESLRAGAVAQLEESLGRTPATAPGNTPPPGPGPQGPGKPSSDAMKAKIVPLDALGGNGSIRAASFVGSAVGSLAVVWKADEAHRREQMAQQRMKQEKRRAENAAKAAEASRQRHDAIVKKLQGHEAALEKHGYVAMIPEAAGDPNDGGRLYGIVLNENREGVPYADIVVTGSGRGGITQNDGSFAIANVPHGSCTVQINRVGYTSRKIENLSVRGGLGTELIILLERNEQTTGRVRIEEDMDEIDVQSSGTSYTITKKEFKTRSVKSVTDAVTKQPLPGAAIESVPVLTEGERARLTAGGYAGNAQAPTSDRGYHPVSVGGTDPVNGRKFDAMFFEHYGVNPFVDAQEDRLATFAVDVDNASYTLTRSYLERNALPPKEAVRVEEFINAFPHDYAPPPSAPFRAASFTEPREDEAGTDRDAFAVHVDVAPSRFGRDLLLMRVGLKGREVHRLDRKPANLTFVIDVSGSMNRENRLGLVKRSLHLLLNELTTNDRVAIVVYGSTAHTVLPPTSLEQRDLIETAIDRLSTGGSTNAEHGLVEGYINAARAFQFGAINRVILCSDGVANVGRTGADEILARIGRDASRGIELTTVGFGMGNYNDVLMEKLANNGNGNYFYVDQLREARRVFVENVTGTLQTIAQQVKAQVEFNDDVVRRYRLLGYENRDVADKDFRNDAVDAGEIGAGHEVTALFEIKLEKRARDRGRIATVRVRHEDPVTFEITERKRDVDLREAHQRFEAADPTFRLDAAVAEFAEILRHSYWAKDGDLNEVYRVAHQAANELRSREQADEFLRLVDRAKGLRDGLVQKRDRPDWMPDDF
ncbi:MAG: DUF3520 domain-containing protein [Gemmatimonadetes bacterium]|nr:DUF3520 domain-containing protein [Gemmatimonadota bacterium]